MESKRGVLKGVNGLRLSLDPAAHRDGQAIACLGRVGFSLMGGPHLPLGRAINNDLFLRRFWRIGHPGGRRAGVGVDPPFPGTSLVSPMGHSRRKRHDGIERGGYR